MGSLAVRCELAALSPELTPDNADVSCSKESGGQADSPVGSTGKLRTPVGAHLRTEYELLDCSLEA